MLRISTALRNYWNEQGGIKDGLQNGKLMIYGGAAQPASADAAPTGTLLVTITDAGGTPTAEVLATGSIELTGGGSGSVNTLTVNSIEIMGSATNFNTSLAQTAADIAAKINANPQNLLFIATVVGAIITLTARRGLGALANGWVVAATVTTITKTTVNMGSGVAGVTALNGLKFGDGVAGAIDKLASQTWSGTAVANGVATWFRYVGSVADSGVLDSTESQMRMDGTVSTSGAQLNLTSTTIASGGVETISSFPVTFPAA